MMKCQGFGRNTSLRYGEGNPPILWDQKLVLWDKNLNGVNSPTNWKLLNKGPWTKALYELIKMCYCYYDEAEEYNEKICETDEENECVEFASYLRGPVLDEHDNNIDDSETNDNFGNLEDFEGTSEILDNTDFSISESFFNIESEDLSLSRLLCETSDGAANVPTCPQNTQKKNNTTEDK